MKQSKLYIYQHIPKCGGTSFRAACETIGLHVILEKLPDQNNQTLWNAFLQNKVDVLSQPQDTLLCGHLIFDGVRPMDRYETEIKNGGAHLVTVLREPLERGISAYFFRKGRGKETCPSLEARLMSMRNPISKHLGHTGDDPRKFLESYFFVGITEHLQASVDVFASIAGKKPIEVPRLNPTERTHYELSDALIADFKRNNKKDYELYDEAVRFLNNKHMSLFGCPIESATAWFQAECGKPKERIPLAAFLRTMLARVKRTS